MSNLNILTSLTLLSVIMAVLFFAYPNLVAPIPYGSFAFALTMATCFWVAARIKTLLGDTFETELTSLLRTFRNYFLVMGTFFFFDGIAHVAIPALYPVDLVASHMHTFSHAFFFIGNAILIRIPISFINSRWKNMASILMIILGIIAVGWRIFNTDKLVYAFGPSSPPIIITDNTSGIIFLITNVLALLVPGLYLLYKGFKTLDVETSRRSSLLGLGMIIFFSIGPVIDIFPGPYLQLLIHLLLASSFFFMGASVLYKAGVSANVK